MGCDIHIFTEVKKNGSWRRSTDEVFTLDKFDQEYHKKEKGTDPFDWRSYGMFGFLAGVRNYSCVPGFECKQGLPEDVTDKVRLEFDNMDGDAHSPSYLTAEELIGFDYDKKFSDRRTTKEERPGYFNGAHVVSEEEGAKTSFREFLGEFFMTHVQELKTLSEQYEDARVVFWFDN